MRLISSVDSRNILSVLPFKHDMSSCRSLESAMIICFLRIHISSPNAKGMIEKCKSYQRQGAK